MLANLLLATALQVGPFYERADDLQALRPIWSEQGETTDILWPLWTSHRDWWRFCFFVHDQRQEDGDEQFEILPFWFSGHDAAAGDYWGLFPFYGSHPHFLLMDDWSFVLWPCWMSYRRPSVNAEDGWLRSQAVLFPLVTWREDGAWGVWPLCGRNYTRTGTHDYALWPLFTRATYRPDRDTGGEGLSWMFWPLCGRVDRAREQQWLFLPPFFSRVETVSGWRLRAPWPLVEVERMSDRDRTSIFPLYETVRSYSFGDGHELTHVRRFGWKLVELYPQETRVFPFWVSAPNYFRLWPFWESALEGDVTSSRALALFPIRWVDAVDRNWAKFWTFYERRANPVCTDHALLWGIIRWRTLNDD